MKINHFEVPKLIEGREQTEKQLFKTNTKPRLEQWDCGILGWDYSHP